MGGMTAIVSMVMGVSLNDRVGDAVSGRNRDATDGRPRARLRDRNSVWTSKLPQLRRTADGDAIGTNGGEVSEPVALLTQVARVRGCVPLAEFRHCVGHFAVMMCLLNVILGHLGSVRSLFGGVSEELLLMQSFFTQIMLKLMIVLMSAAGCRVKFVTEMMIVVLKF